MEKAFPIRNSIKHIHAPDANWWSRRLPIFSIDLENRTKYARTSYPTMNFCVIYQNEEPVKKAYEILKEDANILLPLGSLPWSSCCANLIDKFGVFWYIAVHVQNIPESEA